MVSIFLEGLILAELPFYLFVGNCNANNKNDQKYETTKLQILSFFQLECLHFLTFFLVLPSILCFQPSSTAFFCCSNTINHNKLTSVRTSKICGVDFIFSILSLASYNAFSINSNGFLSSGCSYV